MLALTKKFLGQSANLLRLKHKKTPAYDPVMDKDKRFVQIYDLCREYTQTSRERVYALYQSVVYIIKTGIPGDFLRLDTDWYESTRHELIQLYPHLQKSGVLIIDDYGSWAGSKKAVDEYFSDKGILLSRIDSTGRIGIKIE